MDWKRVARVPSSLLVTCFRGRLAEKSPSTRKPPAKSARPATRALWRNCCQPAIKQLDHMRELT
eukprot:6089865-Prorocentrum_lima.AAC.1